MKKIKLTESEIESLRVLYECQKKANDYNLEGKLKMAQFWFDFNKRKGPGSYRLDSKTLVVLELEESDMKNQHGPAVF